MKYLLILVSLFFSLTLNSQIIAEDVVMYYKNNEMKDGQSLVFENNLGKVSISSDEIKYYSKINERLTIKKIGPPMIFEIINNVIETLNKQESEQRQQLEMKVLFYEKYFGKLVGDMNEECVKWEPVINPPPIEGCTTIKK